MHNYLFHRYLLYLILLSSLLFVRTGQSNADTFVVNSIQDANDLEPGNGLCVAYIFFNPPYVIPFCTLRGAIQETNALPGPDVIVLPSGTFSLSKTGAGENNSLTGDLDIAASLIILGAGPDRTFIDAAGIDRVFDVFGQDTNVIIKDVSIINGRLTSQTHGLQEGGAGIRNAGVLSLDNVTISSNSTAGNSLQSTGGGIFNKASCSLINSALSANSAWLGGGIFNDLPAVLAVSKTTFFNNSAHSGGGLANHGSASLVNVTLSDNSAIVNDSSVGGGIYNSAELNITQATISGNMAVNNGGGLYNQGTVNIVNTIVTENTNTNCNPTAGIFSQGFNLEDQNTCRLQQDTDLINTDPKLTSFDYHGGPTKTYALLIGSPAVDNGKNLLSEGISTDQRGVERPWGRAFDIGAFETKKRSVVPVLVPFLLSRNI